MIPLDMFPQSIDSKWGSTAEESSVPGFAPGDVVTAILNINAGTAQFRKRHRIRGREKGVGRGAFLEGARRGSRAAVGVSWLNRS